MAKIAFTAGRVSGFKCPPDKKQAFMWDATAPGLGLRATPAGKPAYVFQSVYQGKDLRITIGSPAAWSIPDAQAKARELQRLIDEGKDPRDLKRDALAAQAEKQAAAAAKVEADKAAALTVGEVWGDYIEKRRPFWGELHYRDHIDKAKAGGLPSGRRGGGKQLTKPGPLAALMPLALKDLDQTTIERWAADEGKTRPSSARLAWRLLTVFLTWCAEQPEYAALLPDKNPAKTKKAREALGKPGTKSDVLQREQLAAWFAAVRQIQNPVIAACLQMMLLTGARPGEVLALRWEDVNTQWKGISIRDKVEGTREIPATPYMLHLLAALPRRNEWVFSSPTSASGCLTEPNNPHTRACAAAGLEGLTLHGLRRSFASLTEWLEVPAGVVAQIQGHKPSATAEKHYKVRPLELLRVHHERIEAWILEQAGIVFDAKAAPGALRVVQAA
ncbi:tyrosine-type recombinase/integrase [Alicycliphilus denitrificans]|uniref:tyrosine-type recombinase/integrase n=1 Tax=Alicycliphilus denitrificans TaxID=179636 RepID=UPI0001D9E89F|nr:site-specific integrase [Alicycliphilus denitrificans]ADU99336.1 integrase family protein [Alicycliphilus denitrificans BC]